MAASTDLKESTKNILNAIQRICGKYFSGESKIEDRIFENIKDEIEENDAKLVIILKQQLGNVLTDMKENLDYEAPKKSWSLFGGSSSRNHPSDTQRDKVNGDLESVVNKAECLKESVVGDAEIELVGRVKEKKEIIDELILLLSRSQDGAIPVIIIWGISGIGKTKLALHVCQDYYVTQNVGLPAWVSGTEYNTFDVDSIANHVSHNTRSSSLNIIVVLDDWSVEIGDQDVKALQDKLKNVKAIMITTRCCLVRNIAASSFKSYPLPGLDKTESRDLFNRTFRQGADVRAYSSTTLNLEQCRGVPRAIIILAKWLNSPRSQLTTFQEELVYFYYDYVESFSHSCFTYCSLFPKDYSFDSERLIHLWMAEGFLNTSSPSTRSGSSNREAIGRGYLSDLVKRSIYQDVTVDLGEVTKCGTMHPLMHDIARFMADRENIIVYREGKNVHKQVQRASFDKNKDNEIPDRLFSNAKELKSLLLFTRTSDLKFDTMSTKVLDKVFNSFKSLCVLHLRNLGIKEVPSSIGKLKDLKYLDLSENDKMEKLPSSITKLSNLEMLKLLYCYSLKELPKDFKNLTQLKHLDVTRCTGLTCMPRNIAEMSPPLTIKGP